jgi:hypothetical protein
MKTEKELNTLIIRATMQILEKYPELSELLNEMPVTIPKENHPEITVRILEEYLQSLESILKGYGRHIEEVSYSQEDCWHS